MSDWLLRNAFILSGISNLLGILLVTKGFTDFVIMDIFPEMFTTLALVMIQVMGIFYIIVGLRWLHRSEIVLFCAFAKVVYGLSWIYWIANNSLSRVYDRDILAGLFYTLYGPNDLIYALVFAYAGLRPNKISKMKSV